MKCLETEKLIGYAYGLTNESVASQVRAHLRECPRCREIVEEHGRLDAVLSEWRVADPTPGFDARLRQAVEARQAGRAAWGFWSWEGARVLAFAALGLLVVTGAIWFTHRRYSVLPSSQIPTRLPQSNRGIQGPPQRADLQPPAEEVKRSAQAVTETQSVGVALNDDKDAQALEDYDLAANFDLLSELPKGEPRVVN